VTDRDFDQEWLSPFSRPHGREPGNAGASFARYDGPSEFLPLPPPMREELEDIGDREAEDLEGEDEAAAAAVEAAEYEWDVGSESEEEAETAGAKPSRVRARILWPALGFPAVIAPKTPPANSAMLDADATRCVCVLVLSDQSYLKATDAARYLRYVPWAERGRRHIRAGQAGSFAPGELSIRNDKKEPRLSLPMKKKDRWGAIVGFGGDRDGENGIAVSLAHYVRSFYHKQGLSHLHEIRIDEAASGRLADGLYHLFWNNEDPNEKAPSDDMALLIKHFARPRRNTLGALWEQNLTGLLDEYEYEYGALHAPYLSKLQMRRPRAEVLHPVFVRRNRSEPLRIGHITDTHVDVRADVYEENLKHPNFFSFKADWPTVDYNNWNRSFVRQYDDAKKRSDILLLTGDLIDYGRGHLGIPARDSLGDDTMYHEDRNWFLFYYLLATGDAYSVPAYTILGNHDWRLNPYPPLAVAGAPSPKLLINNYDKFPEKDRANRKQKDILEDVLRIAHGPGHERKFSYSSTAETPLQLLVDKLGDAGRALLSMLGGTRTMDLPRTPTETTVESVAWYLFSINPFLDYAFSLPTGHEVLMLDWAEDEDVLFPIAERGKARGYEIWEAEAASYPGPKARNSLTDLQKQLVIDFTAREASGPRKPKIVGIHVPPIGPYTDWYDGDLLKGRKIYDATENPRGPTNYATREKNGMVHRWNGHPLFAIRPPNGAEGMAADYNSLSRAREWFIRELAKNPDVRVVLSGHIHRNGLLVVHQADAGRGEAVAGQLLVRGVTEALVRSAPFPAVARIPEGRRGPLYVNTTSAGPRGNWYPALKQKATVEPGYARVELGSDGTIHRVEFRPPLRVAVPIATRATTGQPEAPALVAD
jgi:hypothetical protein